MYTHNYKIITKMYYNSTIVLFIYLFMLEQIQQGS